MKLNTFFFLKKKEKEEAALWLFVIGPKGLKLFSSHISADSHEMKRFEDEPIKSDS